MYYRSLRKIYRYIEPGRPTHESLAKVLDCTGYYARKCLRTGCFTIQDKRRILLDLGVDDADKAAEIFPVMGN